MLEARLRARILAIPALLAGCWKLDVTEMDGSVVAFTPDVGAPEGWVVESFDMELTCPDGDKSRFYLVYPTEAADAPVGARPALPLAILFHSGAFDYVFLPTADEPIDGQSYQESLRDGATNRLTSRWGVTQAFTTLGLYPNYNANEIHAGTLPAALATKGIAVMIPVNCWGDYWHNRSSLAENNFDADFFFRNGRTAAEFAWLHATTTFPPSNPVELPIDIDTERVYLVGLGEGARAVSELLSTRVLTDETPAPFAYVPAAVVFDSPVDDLRPYLLDGASADYAAIRSGLSRIFPGSLSDDGRNNVMPGSLAWAPLNNIPDRTGWITSANDSYIPEEANDLALTRLEERAPEELWRYEAVAPAHVVSNGDVGVAKAVADFLADGPDAIDPQYVSD
jgi:hypothetical protein